MAVWVPVTFAVSASIPEPVSFNAPLIKIDAAALSVPKSLVVNAASLCIFCNSRKRSENVIEVSPSLLISTPAFSNSFAVSFGKNRPSPNLFKTLRNDVPASAPTLPPAAKICIALFVSSKLTLDFDAATPATLIAAATSGTSDAPNFAPAASVFIATAIASAAFLGSAKSTPNCNNAPVNASVAAPGSSPVALDNVLTDSAILLRASGLFAISGPSFERMVLNASILALASVPNLVAML